MDEGSLPHARSVDKPEQLEEERRLAYVGFTRAMRRLYLVRAFRRSFFGESHPTEPSRFLEDIPLRLVSSTGSGSSHESAGLRSMANRRGNWDDDYNQDIYSSNDTGRTFGSGKSGVNSRPSQWSPRPSAYSSSTVPPSSTQRNKDNLTPLSSSSQKMPPVSPSTSASARPKSQQYKSGDKVRHDKFGEGVILKSEMEQGTEFVEVQFQGKHGKKRLSMDFAKLERI
jgi:DNA helicase-2/ATP-dependent DNA helicase PcrA